jgi:hypothetical protein
MTDQAGPLKVIFVASLSHSGSTLLDLMLNAHPDVVSVGELKQLGRFARSEKPRPQLNCTCGAESLMSCDFWGGVSAVTKATVGRTIRELNVDDYDDVDTFQGDNVALFKAIAAVAGKRIIVDSSKQVARFARLLEIHQLEVFPIFLLLILRGRSARRKSAQSTF